MSTSSASPPRDTADRRKGKTVGAVASASKVLRYLQAAREPVTATQINRDLGLNPSTCFNILQTLADEDFVDLDEQSKTYTLSLGVVPLARRALEQSAGLRALQPKLQEFSLKHNLLSAVLRRVSRDRCVVVAAAESDAPIRIQATIGSQAPLLLGAGGRVFGAWSGLSDSEIEAGFSRLRLARALDFETFKEQLAEVRQTGWAIDDGYYTPGTVSIAAPVFDLDGRVTLCCSAIMFNGQHDPRRLSLIAAELVELCRAASNQTLAAPLTAEAESPTAGLTKARRPKKLAKATSRRTRQMGHIRLRAETA